MVRGPLPALLVENVSAFRMFWTSVLVAALVNVIVIPFGLDLSKAIDPMMLPFLPGNTKFLPFTRKPLEVPD